MLLALDVGNTNITIGLFKKSKLVFEGRIPTYGPRTEGEYLSAVRRQLSRSHAGKASCEGVIISSVVPHVTAVLKKAIFKLSDAKPLVLGENIHAPVINRYKIPSQVGQDRLVNAAAACFLYGGPVVVVDFGTAITIDLVTRRREYLGGVIVPGMEIALEALSSRAALLPRIALRPPKEFLGRDTVTSMQSGIFYGYGALCDGLVLKMKKRQAPSAKVVATGGHSRLIAQFCKSVHVINPQLTLQGLEIIHRVAGNA